MVLALPELIWLALLLFAFAVVYTLRAFVEAMLGTLISDLEAIPVIGGKLAGLVDKAMQAVSSALGSAEGGIDRALGASLHLLAKYTVRLWDQFKTHATLLARLADGQWLVDQAVHGLRSLVNHATAVGRAVLPRVKALEKEYHGIEHRVKSLEHKIARGIGHDLRIQVAGLETDVGKIENKVIPSLRSAEAQAEKSISDLWKWVHENALVAGTAAFAGAVAVALSSLGLGWLRCSSNPFNNNKQACGLWSVLGRVLTLAGFLGLAFDFKAFVSAAEFVASGIGEAVASIEGEFDLALPPLPPPLD